MGLGSDLGGAIGGLGALFGGDDGSAEYKKRMEALAANAGKLDPSITAGQETPEQQAASLYGSVDPASRNAEMDALRELQTQYRSGGLDAQGKAALAQSETEANRQNQARSNAITEQARAGGMGNSAVTLALKNQAAQQAGEQANRSALGAAALSQGNRMAALTGAGHLGGQVRSQDQATAAAQDAVNRYNAIVRQGVQGRNIDRTMGAQQQTFSNSLHRLGAQGGFYGGAYGAQQTADQRSRAAWAAVGKGVGAAIDDGDLGGKLMEGQSKGGGAAGGAAAGAGGDSALSAEELASLAAFA